MLQINPVYRTSAKDLLKNKIFDKIRNSKLEIGSKVRVEIEEDDDYEVADDLDKFRTELRSCDPNVIDYFKRKILNQLLTFN
jgi:hypothetical protein